MLCLRYGGRLRQFDLQEVVADVGLRLGRINGAGEIDGAENVMEGWIAAISNIVEMTRMPVAGEGDTRGGYPNLEGSGREPAGIGANDERVIFRRFAAAEVAVEFTLGLPPIF